VHAFDVLGDPVRRRILELLATGEQSSGAITAVIMREFRMVRPQGTRRLYSVASGPLQDVDRWLDHFRGSWSQPLDALATELARGRRERRLAGEADRDAASDPPTTKEHIA
jgi:hypothetical protein